MSYVFGFNRRVRKKLSRSSRRKRRGLLLRTGMFTSVGSGAGGKHAVVLTPASRVTKSFKNIGQTKRPLLFRLLFSFYLY